jgi:hypothetical protein
MKNISIISMFAFCNVLALFNPVHAQVADWIAPESGMGTSVASDPFDNTYACGQIIGTTTIGSFVLTSAGAQDVSVVKHNMSGTVLWATAVGGAGGEFSTKVVYDGYGGVWVTGQFSGTMNAGSFTLTSTGSGDVFIVKLDALTGAVLFAEHAGGAGSDGPADLEVDAAGNIYAVGYFSGSMTYPGVTISGLGSTSVFILKIDNSGTGISGWKITGSPSTSTWNAGIDNAGNIYIAGLSNPGSSVNFNGTSVTVTGNHYFVKFNSAGVFQWAATALFNGEVYGLTVDASGNVYFTGNFDTSADFGSTTLTTSGPNDDIILVKLNNAGNYVWAKSFGGSGNDEGYDLKCKPTGELFLTGSFIGSFSFGSLPVTGGPAMRGYVAMLDSSGTEQWIQPAYSITSATWFNGIEISGTDNVFVTGATGGLLTMAGDTATTTASCLVRLADNANVMEGFVFNDSNNDGVKNSGEPGIQNVILQLDGGYYVENSASDGKYNMYTTSGAHSVGIPNLPLYHTLTTASTQTATFSGMGNTDTANHFGLFPVANVKDLQVDITPVTSVKAGYVIDYMITCKNVGTLAQNATLTVVGDGILVYVGSSPVATTISGTTLTWNLGILNPGQIEMIHALYNIPSSTAVGTPVNSTATLDPVSGDTTATNNTMISAVAVTAPFDPNYKMVDIDTLWDITSSGWLEYTIHFQNVGNDTVYNVIIIDTMSSYLNLGTLEILATSHSPMTFNINGGNVLDFRFENIYLPDSTTDQVGSNGFIKFRVKYLATLPVNQTIDNFADIYFDFNAPIRTNTAYTIHLSTSGVHEISTRENQWLIYPNPTSGSVTIQTSHPGNFVLQNSVGQVLQSFALNSGNNFKLTVDGLTNGVYFIRELNTLNSQKVIVTK